MAIAPPRPIAFTSTISALTNARLTTITTSAALVMTRPLPGKSERDGVNVIRARVAGFHDPREKKHLVIHAKSEEQGEEDYRQGGFDESQRLESQKAGEPAVLKDQDQHAKARHKAHHVHNDRLQRQDGGPEQDR